MLDYVRVINFLSIVITSRSGERRNGSTSDVFGKVTPVVAYGRRWDRLRSTARRASVCSTTAVAQPFLNTADVAYIHAAPIVANRHAQ